ncbi:FYN-binding protein 1 isoform 2-T2 [Aulostomus maculatus]
MENKTDVKAIMARFQASGASTDESSSTSAGRTKPPLHPTLSSGPPIPIKKPVLESLSGSAINTPPKPTVLKNTVSTKSDTEVQTKPLASRFLNTQEDTNVNNKPFTHNNVHIPLKPTPSLAPEAKSPLQKPLLHKPPLSNTQSDSKPAFPKPPAASIPKPSWVKEDTDGGSPSTISSTPPKLPPLHHKPSSSFAILRQQGEEISGSRTDKNKPSTPATTSSFTPSSNFRAAQNISNKEKMEQSDCRMNVDAGGKLPLPGISSNPPPKPPASKKPSLRNPSCPTGNINGDATSGPKRKPLPKSFTLGPAPAKPNRPPRVNLENFSSCAEVPNGAGTFKKAIIPLHSHPSNHSNHVTQPPKSELPSLPPRHLGTIVQPEDFYDDVDELNNAPPPLPPSAAHPSQKPKEEPEDDKDDSGGEMYEELDDRWEEHQEKEKDKVEKKRLEAEKKEQKEREKKEQDARKKFKLVGPVEVIHQGKACVDCRGSKTDLALKQGDCLDIIRVQGNPEGKWLGRTLDGSIGFVKTTSVEIDFNTLKSHKAQQAYDPEVYDDIDVASSGTSEIKGPGVVLPPPPEEGEIYDDVVDPNFAISVPPPSQFTTDGNAGATITEEIYDDVDAQNLPPLPPISSLPTLKGKSKTEDMDPKKQKKFEKEEKDFRKKFKYDGEIQVLYQVKIIPILTNKRWTGKDLSVKAGETLDVIVKAEDNKLICRNEEGKFGYVSTSHTVTDDGDIYDDIGDDCIYDND